MPPSAPLNSTWWTAHRPRAWSDTGIGACLRTYEQADDYLTRNNVKVGVNDVRGLAGQNLAQARAAKRSLTEIVDTLARLSRAKLTPAETADVDRLARVAQQALAGYRYVT